jgi:hypothetical protein
MSTTPPAAPHRQVPGEALSGQNEIRIVSHSTLFYWWPVWAIGYIMAIITLIDGHNLAIVPSGTQAALVPSSVTEKAKVNGTKNSFAEIKNHEVLVAPEPLPAGAEPRWKQPKLQMAQNKNLGVIFATVLLLVIAITNIPFRGLWSVIVIVVIIFTAIILALADLWRPIVEAIELLSVHINLAGYIVISTVLLVMWLIVLLLFDQQIYMVFTPGQLRVRLEIGEGETAYDTRGMTIQKQRSDLFRHWILGLGSGDLIVNTAGAQVHHFDLPNVLFVGRKVKEIEDMLRSMPVVRSPQ